MKNSIARFLRDEEGATAIEYGIIAGAVAVVLIATFVGPGGIGASLQTIFEAIETGLVTAAS